MKKSPGRSPPPPPPPPIPATLAATVSRIAVAQICRCAGYHAAEASALRALADVSSRYLLALARAAASAASADGRTDANLLDLAIALEELTLTRGFPGGGLPGGPLFRSSAGPLRGLINFVASVDEIPFARPIRREASTGGDPPGLAPTFSQMRREPPFPHVPRWLPGFPDTWEGGRGQKDQRGVEKGGFGKEEPEQLTWLPASDRWPTVKRERKRRLLPAERTRVRFRLGGLAGWEKRRKTEITAAVGKPLEKRMVACQE